MRKERNEGKLKGEGQYEEGPKGKSRGDDGKSGKKG